MRGDDSQSNDEENNPGPPQKKLKTPAYTLDEDEDTLVADLDDIVGEETQEKEEEHQSVADKEDENNINSGNANPGDIYGDEDDTNMNDEDPGAMDIEENYNFGDNKVLFSFHSIYH